MQNWSAPVLNPVLNPLDQGAVDAYWDELSLAFGTAVRLARALLLTSFHRACLVIGLVLDISLSHSHSLLTMMLVGVLGRYLRTMLGVRCEAP